MKKNREDFQYPFPVLCSWNNGYTKSTFDNAVTVIHEPGSDDEDLVLDVKASTNNPEINELIKSGRAVAGCHVICDRTYVDFMAEFPSKEMAQPSHKIVIPGSQIDALVKITPVIIATQDIGNFQSSDLDSMYNTGLNKEGERINPYANPVNFPKNCYIANGDIKEISISKSKAHFKQVETFIYVKQYDDDNDNKVTSVNLDEDNYIVINVTKEMAGMFNQLKQNHDMNNPILAALYAPSLQQVISVLFEAEDNAFEYGSYHWYSSLMKLCEKKNLGSSVSELKKTGLSAQEISEFLIGDPLTKMFNEAIYKEDK